METNGIIRRVKPHSTKAVFRRHGLRVCDIAATVGRSYGYTVNVLNGVLRPSPELDSQLRKLAEAITGKEV